MRDTNGWVGLGWVGVLRYYSLAQTLTKPENPRTKKKKDRQQNNAVITVVTRTKSREKKKERNRDRVRCFSSSRGEVAVVVGAAPHNHHIW